VFGFLVATHRSEQDASDVFSDFSLGLLKGMQTFDWKGASLRTFAYTIARNASHRFRRDSARRERGGRANPSALDDVAQAVRTETLTFLRTQTKTKLQQLRDELPPEDQELLVLRVDRNLAWNDLAMALHDGDAPLSAEDLQREAQRLRKRFQLIKERLHEAARREGLVS
jgi:RNA polymerase sigma-70 factor (ECF subfamily)